MVDFVCLEKSLVIEIDGESHTSWDNNDAVRDAWLRKEGYRVIRFWNNEIMENMEGVLEAIERTINSPSSPPPRGGRPGGDEKASPSPTPPLEGGDKRKRPTPPLEGGDKRMRPTPPLEKG